MASPRVKVSNVRVSSVPHCGHQWAMGGGGGRASPAPPGGTGDSAPQNPPGSGEPSSPTAAFLVPAKNSSV